MGLDRGDGVGGKPRALGPKWPGTTGTNPIRIRLRDCHVSANWLTWSTGATDSVPERNWTTPVRLVIIFTGLALLPSLFVMMTSFTRIVIVLGFVRRALSTQSIPPNIAMIGLALFLTLYTMAPTFERMNTEAVQPYLQEEIDFGTAGMISAEVLKEFMLRNCRQADLALFVQMAHIDPPETPRIWDCTL